MGGQSKFLALLQTLKDEIQKEKVGTYTILKLLPVIFGIL